jgi:hypothetical protein
MAARPIMGMVQDGSLASVLGNAPQYFKQKCMLLRHEQSKSLYSNYRRRNICIPSAVKALSITRPTEN